MKRTILLAGFALATLVSLPSAAQDPSGRRSLPALPQPTTVTQISSNMVEFYYLVTTGSGQYDHIGLHRVTLVDKKGNPKPSDDAVLMLHGDVWPFDGAFFRGISRDSIAAYLAAQGVDVWGIDLAWTLVPSTENNFTFMANWGMAHDITDTETALTFARSVRSQTGSDGGQLTLLGWSRGGFLGYGLLDQESQQSCNQRQVKAYISVDNFYKTDSPESQANMCAAEAAVDQELANGVYNTDFTIYRTVGDYAIQAPDSTSPPDLCDTPFTNLTCSLAQATDYSNFVTPYYHFAAGYFANNDYQSGVPNGLAYTNPGRLNALWVGVGSYENLRMLAETYSVTCGDDPSLPFDKHLGDIKVPVHYVGAGGGFGSYGLYTLSLLGSKDVTHHIISFYPPPQQALDFGHVDLFYADDAQDLVWEDILDFLQKHSHQANGKCNN